MSYGPHIKISPLSLVRFREFLPLDALLVPSLGIAKVNTPILQAKIITGFCPSVDGIIVT